MNIGVLAIQGAFAEHTATLKQLNVNSFEIRKKRDLNKSIDGLILPGGESTVIGKLLENLDMMNTIKDYIKGGMPVFGTCAGLIMLAKDIENSQTTHLATMDISVVRNGYGKQINSFNTKSEFQDKLIDMPFIRAPYIKETGDSVKVLSVVDNKIVAVQQGNQLATSFHPELTEDTTVHKYFLDIINEQQH